MTFDEWWASRPLSKGDLPLVRKAIMDECLSAWLAAQAQRPEAATHDRGPTHRWNIEERDGEVYICKGDHDAYAPCRFEHYSRSMNKWS